MGTAGEILGQRYSECNLKIFDEFLTVAKNRSTIEPLPGYLKPIDAFLTSVHEKKELEFLLTTDEVNGRSRIACLE